jgi:hypothetical protein
MPDSPYMYIYKKKNVKERKQFALCLTYQLIMRFTEILPMDVEQLESEDALVW